jgi:hypothetical protein
VRGELCVTLRFRLLAAGRVGTNFHLVVIDIPPQKITFYPYSSCIARNCSIDRAGKTFETAYSPRVLIQATFNTRLIIDSDTTITTCQVIPQRGDALSREIERHSITGTVVSGISSAHGRCLGNQKLLLACFNEIGG